VPCGRRETLGSLTEAFNNIKLNLRDEIGEQSIQLVQSWRSGSIVLRPYLYSAYSRFDENSGILFNL
jgi:hypothetical protein